MLTEANTSDSPFDMHVVSLQPLKYQSLGFSIPTFHPVEEFPLQPPHSNPSRDGVATLFHYGSAVTFAETNCLPGIYCSLSSFVTLEQ